ncbi:MAG: cytochrome-c peroxidase [Saprospiraceae bacterium]|nr:cytochrome-c peroxidase [Saprospiraceae bacterium]
MSRWIYILFLISLILACSEEKEFAVSLNSIEIPIGFPEMEFPEDNPYTSEAWTLGKSLFYDPILSLDSTISCATCHIPELAFSDGLATSIGINERVGRRNAPSLANVGYHLYFTREGGVPTLEMQVLVPIQEHDEMHFNIVLAAERLQKSSTYIQASLKAYGRTPDPYVITRALANFERMLISGNSKYDKFLRGEMALTAEELHGRDLFNSDELKCASCHGGFNFTDYRFANNGVYATYEDLGRMRLTNNDSDEALFKTPSLRNVAITQPYMHDGSFNTIEEVIEHYARGGSGHINQSNLIKGFELTQEDQKALIAFLYTLTDQEFISNELFKEE